MKAHHTAIDGLLILEPDFHGDDRGFFMETWTKSEFSLLTGSNLDFVQDNHSKSRFGVLRGLHYQLPPHEQGKLVRTVVGGVFDVAVDLRRGSETFGCWAGAELTATNRKQLWVPPGFAHGFLSLSEGTEVCYKATGFYAPESDRVISWDDPDIAISWPLAAKPNMSDKDAAAPRLRDAEVFDN